MRGRSVSQYFTDAKDAVRARADGKGTDVLRPRNEGATRWDGRGVGREEKVRNSLPENDLGQRRQIERTHTVLNFY